MAQECESLMREAFLLVGAISLHTPMVALYASPKKREPNSSLSQRQGEGCLSCKATRSRKSGACSWTQDTPRCLSCHLNNHRVYKDFLPGTHPGFLPRPLLVWVSVSVFCLPADHTQQETDEAPGRMLASACWQP